jgi:hypothetical protein
MICLLQNLLRLLFLHLKSLSLNQFLQHQLLFLCHHLQQLLYFLELEDPLVLPGRFMI